LTERLKAIQWNGDKKAEFKNAGVEEEVVKASGREEL